jgi:3-phosphoinositide dependent protein kinase-1
MAVGIVMEILDVHSKNIIHRKLKPDNVLLDGQHRMKICDVSAGNFMEIAKTREVGTPIYMASE